MAIEFQNVRNPNHHYFSKRIAIHLQLVLQYTSNLYCSAFGVIELSGKGNTSVRLPFVPQYASHLYRNTPPICIAILLGKSWWLWPPGCSPEREVYRDTFSKVSGSGVDLRLLLVAPSTTSGRDLKRLNSRLNRAESIGQKQSVCQAAKKNPTQTFWSRYLRVGVGGAIVRHPNP